MKASNPLVSVLMNCHNGEEFLIQSIESILNQSYSNLELIFFDNCSTDNSSNIINSFKDNRIKYYSSKKKLSLSEARIAAWQHIQGEYVAVLDTDDLALPNRISTQINFFLKNENISIVGGNCHIIDSKNNIIYNSDFSNSSEELAKQIFYSFPFNNSTLMFRKKHVDLVGGYPKNYTMINDYVLVYKLSRHYTLANTNEIISKNRIHKKSLTNKNHITNLIEQYKFLNEIADEIDEKDIMRKNKIYLSRYYIKVLIYSLLNRNMSVFFSFLSQISFLKIFYFIFPLKF